MLITRARALSIFVMTGVLCIATLAHAATLALINSVPINNAVDTSRTDALSLQFSAAIATQSVRADTVTLQSSAGIQKASLSVSGAVVSIRPLTPLLPWTSYTLSATSLTGTGGEQLATPVTVVFKTRDETWQTPQL